MKIALFIGEILPHGQKLKEFLEDHGYSCILTTNPDEIDQIGQQMGKASLIFFDAGFAYKYLAENNWPEFSRINLVYLHKKPIVSPENQKKLDARNLILFEPNAMEKLLASLENFKSNSSNDNMEEIEFAVNEQVQKEQK